MWIANRADCVALIGKLFERLPRTGSKLEGFQWRPEEQKDDEENE
jgi:hypothetical protein